MDVKIIGLFFVCIMPYACAMENVALLKEQELYNDPYKLDT